MNSENRTKLSVLLFKTELFERWNISPNDKQAENHYDIIKYYSMNPFDE